MDLDFRPAVEFALLIFAVFPVALGLQALAAGVAARWIATNPELVAAAVVLHMLLEVVRSCKVQLAPWAAPEAL